MATTFEYKMVSLGQRPLGDWAVFQVDGAPHPVEGTDPTEFFNELGRKGWELVTSYSVNPREGMYPTSPTFVFKRPIPGEHA
jgi:hypothetical protein